MRNFMLLLLGIALAACSGGGGTDPLTDAGTDTPAAVDAATEISVDTTAPDETGTDLPPVDSVTDTPAAELPDDVGQGFPCEAAIPVIPTTGFFTDISDAAGIRVNGYLADHAIKVPINDHSRLAFADINGDGWDDMVMHSLFPNPQAGIPFEHLVFLNDGDGAFTDFSAASGLKDIQAGFFAFGDVDNDGDQDCFAGLDIDLPTATHALLLNDGEGHFTVKADAGIATAGMPKAVGNAVFADFDSDGDLDLFVGLGQTSYVADDWFFLGNGDGSFTAANDRLGPAVPHPTNGSTTCDWDDDGDPDIIVSTYSVSTNAGLNVLWRNDGGHFTDVAVGAGFASLPTGNYYLASTGNGTAAEPGAGPGSWIGSNGFGLDCDDLDNDGLMDIFITTISHPVDGDYNRKWSDPTQVLYNLGSHEAYAFENRFLAKGLPFNEGDVDGAAVDFDNDGRMDLSISRDNKYEGNYEALEQKAWFGLMHQLPDGTFESLGPDSGINDLDVAYAASILECTTDDVCPEGEACLFTRCRNPCQVNADCPAAPDEYCAWGWNTDLGAHQGYCRPYYAMKKAQNHAWSDVDHDGDLDLLVGGRDIGGGRPNFLFRNDIGHQNRWLAVRVKGDGAAVNRDGIGARVAVIAGDVKILREVKSSRGMYNSEDTRVQHLGLGMIGCEYDLQIRWPDGASASFPSGTFPEDTYLTITYPDVLSW